MNKYLEKVAGIVNMSSVGRVFKEEAPKVIHIGNSESNAAYNAVKARLGPVPRANDIYHQGIMDKITEWKKAIVHE